ncbi:MAG: helix-turn-helix domain-containing protein [Saprospiraceae bacterium]|nr:helix-turn-helix domain-containing protein [Saprospiraceae bacterium]
MAQELVVLTKSELCNLLDDYERRIINQLQVKINYTLPPIDWLSISQLSQYLNISFTTVHSWSKQGILTKHKIGRKTRFKKEEVLSALTKLEARNHRICKK